MQIETLVHYDWIMNKNTRNKNLANKENLNL